MNGTSERHVFDDIVQSLTGGKPFVFVIMAYQKGKAYQKGHEAYDQCKEIVEREGLACLRADDVDFAGYDLLDKIHRLIEHSELVVAEISPRGPGDFSPNVYYEVGYAVAKQKAVLLLAKRGTEIPTDLRGMEVVEHDGDSGRTSESFKHRFLSNLRNRLNPGTGLLRDMLQGNNPKPAIIVASPKYPGKHSRIRGQLYDRRTFGDNLGIVGLLSGFGKIFGEHGGCELISASYEEPESLNEQGQQTLEPILRLQSEDVNLYLVGSKKVNKLSGLMLASLVRGKSPGWELAAAPGEKEENDYMVALYKHTDGEPSEEIKGKKKGEGSAEVHVVDHGIVIRGPHPKFPDRVVVIMAGPHSLGTAAACLAATRSTLIRQIRDRIPTADRKAFADKSRTLWALVQGRAGDDGMLNEEQVRVVEAGVYE